MVGRGEAKKACTKELIQNLKEDRISQLPDPLICQILSHLLAKDAVKTSVLSSRWTSLWLWVPSLKLESYQFLDFNALVSFGHKFFDSNRVSCIHKLELTIMSNITDDAFYFTPWIDAVVKRRIQHLCVRCYSYWYFAKMPISLYICETIVSLKLHKTEWVSAEFVSMPCLKTMHLYDNMFPDEASFETLVSCCPVLEELLILVTWNHTKVYRVYSLSLKRLTFKRFGCVPEVFIDAPLLCGLEITNSISNFSVLNNLESIAKLEITTRQCYENARDSSSRSRIGSFLSRISRVRDMKICTTAFKAIRDYSKFEPLPQFGYMSRLHVSLNAHDFKILTTFLERSPNLKSLALLFVGRHWVAGYEEEMNHINFPFVPKCLLSSLEFVDFEVRFKGDAEEMKLVKYFLENSAILKKLTVCLGNSSAKDDVFKELLKIPRGSTKCEVVVI